MPLHREPLPEHYFHRFYWELNHRLDDGSDPPWDNQPAADKGLPLAVKADRLPENTFATFREALRAVVLEKPLYLVLDDFGGQQPVLGKEDFNLHVRPLLFDAIAKGYENGGLGPVYLILLLTEKECLTYGLTADVSLGLRGADTFIDLACEFFEYQYYEDKKSSLPPKVKEIIRYEWEESESKRPWSPSELVEYYAEKKKRLGWH